MAPPLVEADSKWLMRLAGGVAALQKMCFLAAVLSLVGAGMLLVRSEWMPIVIAATTALVASLLSQRCKVVTEPEPGGPAEGDRYRVIARRMLPVTLGMWSGAAFAGATQISGAMPARWAGTFAIAALITYALAGLTAVIGWGALAMYARTLARRLGDDVLMRRTTIVAVGIAIAGLVPAPPLLVALVTQSLGGLIAAVFAGLGIALMISFRRRLDATVDRAIQAYALGGQSAAPSPAPARN